MIGSVNDWKSRDVIVFLVNFFSTSKTKPDTYSDTCDLKMCITL
jgi:hypothetical protein